MEKSPAKERCLKDEDPQKAPVWKVVKWKLNEAENVRVLNFSNVGCIAHLGFASVPPLPNLAQLARARVAPPYAPVWKPL